VLSADGLENQEGAKTGTLAEFALIEQKMNDELDSMSETGTMQQMRLQMVMDRRAKLFEALSNIMKKMSATKETLNGNLK